MTANNGDSNHRFESEVTVQSSRSGSSARRLGDYKLLQRIGEGGMGEVWEAEQLEPVRRTVAVKIIRRGLSSGEILARFEGERQALALMDHPSIAKVLDAGTSEGGRPFFVMEMVHGVPITDYCDRHRLTVAQRLELLVQVCHGVYHAHQKAVIHRDLKPSNILITDQDGRPFPKIIDFGVAKATAQRLTERTLFTELGQIIGTPKYMCPEQADVTTEDVDTRTDVYSLGMVLYELLVGAPPFDFSAARRAGFAALMQKILVEEPPRPSTRVTGLGDRSPLTATNRRTQMPNLVRTLRGDLDWIVMKAIEKDRGRRYDSALTLGQDIERFLSDDAIEARPPSPTYRAMKFVKRNRIAAALVTVIALLLVGFGVALSAQSLRLARDRDRLSIESRKTRAINSFLLEMIGAPSPYRGTGREVTVIDALAASRQRLESAFSEQPEVEASIKSTLGELYRQMGHYEDAVSLHTAALEIRRDLYGTDHAEIAESLFGLGSTDHDAQRLDRAGPLYDSALEMLENLRGDHRQALFEIQGSRARLLRDQGDLAEAELLFGEVLALGRSLYGESHEKVAIALYDLGGLLIVADRLDEAKPLLLRSLEIQRDLLPENHPDIAPTLQGLGYIAVEDGDYDKADAYFSEALSIQRRTLGDFHEEVAVTLSHLGRLRRHAGDLPGAEEALVEALAINRRVFVGDNSRTANSLWSLGVLYGEMGRFERGEELFQQALRAYESSLEPTHYVRLTIRSSYGLFLTLAERYVEAEAELLSAFSDLREVLGEDDSRTRDAAERLIGLYEVWGRPDKVSKYRQFLEQS